MSSTSDVNDIRRQKLQQLRGDYKSLRKLATDVQVAHSYLSLVLSGQRAMGEEVAGRIEKMLGQPTGWMSRADDEADDARATTEPVAADELKLLADYRQLPLRHRTVLREMAADYVRLAQLNEHAEE
jgi:hypothetical protein